MSGSVTAHSASHLDGAVMAALIVLIIRTRLTVQCITLHQTTSAILLESLDVAVRANAFTSRGSATRILTVKMALTKQTVSYTSLCLHRQNHRLMDSGEVNLASMTDFPYQLDYFITLDVYWNTMQNW